jgi:hypothetical protein
MNGHIPGNEGVLLRNLPDAITQVLKLGHPKVFFSCTAGTEKIKILTSSDKYLSINPHVPSRRAQLLLVLGLEYSASKQNKDLQWTSHIVPSLLYVLSLLQNCCELMRPFLPIVKALIVSSPVSFELYTIIFFTNI